MNKHYATPAQTVAASAVAEANPPGVREDAFDDIGTTTEVPGFMQQGKAKPQFDYIIQLAHILEVSLDHLILGGEGQTRPQFEIQNKKLKELCKQVDGLKPEDQEVVCHFLDMAVKHDQLKQLVIRP